MRVTICTRPPGSEPKYKDISLANTQININLHTLTQTTEIFRCVGVNNINIYTNMQKVNEINNCKCMSVEKQSNT